jgi:hypothetical protein
MESAMRARLIAIALLLTGSGAAFADPANGGAAKPAQPEQRPVHTVLASADPVKAPAPDVAQPLPAPVKHRIVPRVTTCRCGDAQAVPDTQEQQ